MKNERLKKAVKESSVGQSNDTINQRSDSGVSQDSVLSLGYIGNNGSTPVKKQYDVWNMSVVLTSALHMLISEATKPIRERNNFKMEMGLKMALSQADLIYESHPKTILTHEISGDDIRLSVGYTGLMGKVALADLPAEKKKNMYFITKMFNGIIGEVVKPNKERDKTLMGIALEAVVRQADTFHKNNKGVSLFHDLNIPR